VSHDASSSPRNARAVSTGRRGEIEQMAIAGHQQAALRRRERHEIVVPGVDAGQRRRQRLVRGDDGGSPQAPDSGDGVVLGNPTP
jgi:hypothetical protein